jgi:phage protein D
MVPIYKIEVDGKDVTKNLVGRVISIEVTDRAGSKDDSCIIAVDDRDQELSIPRYGVRLTVHLGFEGAGVEKIGSYIVNEIGFSGPARIMAIKCSGMEKKASGRKERSWSDTTLGDIAKKIAAENKLKPAVDSKFGAIKIEHEDQSESDTEFLSRLCLGIGCVFKIGDGKLIIAETGTAKSSSGKNLPTIKINAEDVSDWNADLTSEKYTLVYAKYFDPKLGEVFEESAGSGQPELSLSKTYPTKEAAKKACQAALNSVQQADGNLSISGLTGNPKLSAECKIKTVGFRKGIDDKTWIVEAVKHSYNESNGYTCSINATIKI